MASSTSREIGSSGAQGVVDTRRMECPVCFEIYLTGNGKKPKVLRCGHSVCGDCCQKLTKQNLNIPGNWIQCPNCLRDSMVPSGGLPINYALQDMIQHYQNIEEEMIHCIKCARSCTADEAWLMGPEKEIICAQCIMVKYSDTGSALPAGMESISGLIRRHNDYLSQLKPRLAKEQLEWAINMDQALLTMDICSDNIVQSTQELQKTTKEDVAKLNNEFKGLTMQTSPVNVPQSLEGLAAIEQTIQDVSSKLDKLADARQLMITKANEAVNSMALGLDCILNAGKNKGGEDLVGDKVDGNGLVGPPEERQQEKIRSIGRGRGRPLINLGRLEPPKSPGAGSGQPF